MANTPSLPEPSRRSANTPSLQARSHRRANTSSLQARADRWANTPSLQECADRWAILSLIAYGFGIAGWLLLSGVHATFDDGYYYLTIARNLAAGAGASFDGVSVTSGYHPLWLLFLVPIFRVSRDPEAALLVAGVLQAVMATATTVLVFTAVRRRVARGAAVFAALVWVALTYRLWLSGLEFGLHALLVLLVVNLYLGAFQPFRDGPHPQPAADPPARAHQPDPPGRPSLRLHLALGTLLGLTFLARLDAVLLAGVLGAWLLAGEIGRGLDRCGRRRLLALAATVGAAVAGYLAVTWYSSGYPLPVSGLVKRGWSLELLAADPVYAERGWLVAKLRHALQPLRGFAQDWYYRSIVLGVFAAAPAFVAIPMFAPARAWYRRVLAPWLPFFIYSAASYLFFVVAYHRGLSFSAWYYVMPPLIAAVLAAAIADLLERATLSAGDRVTIGAVPSQGRLLGAGLAFVHQRASVVPAALAIGMALVIVYGIWSWQQLERVDPTRLLYHNAARWIRENLPPDAVVGSWNAGTIGYRSDRRVVNLDGVVNDLAFYQSRRHDLCRYWESARVTHIVDVFEGDRALSVVPTFPAYARCADRLELLWRDDRYPARWELRAYRLRPER
jgi:hypothetical protein